jgi:PKD repeat protein
VVEFAIVLPVMLLLLLMAIDFGRLFFSYVQINNAAREGAAYAAANPTDLSGITTYARQETDAQSQRGEGTLAVSAACADPSGVAIACVDATGGAGAGNRITVTVKEPFSFLTPLINTVFGNNLDMSASATAAVLGLAPGAGASAPPGCPSPSAAFTVTVSGLTVNLDASASSPLTGACAIAGFNWDMGDGLGAPIVGQTTSYTYGSSGSYTITLSAGNSNPLPGTAQQTVVVGSASPSATPTASPTPSPAPTPTPLPTCTSVPSFTYSTKNNGGHPHELSAQGAYTGSPAPPASGWSWAFGDGYTATGQNVGHNYAASGTYGVSLTITTSSCTATVTQSIRIP